MHLQWLTELVKAIGYTSPGDPSVLTDVEVPDPEPGPRDLLVEVEAISVNPVDTKVRSSTAPDGDGPKILGWDVAGTVRSVGAEASMFGAGDRVWYAGSLTRPGADSELHVVDERLAARSPVSIDAAHAAALPLTAITAWELLFDRLGITRDDGRGDDRSHAGTGRSLLIVGAAGGVGSMLIQLAVALTDLRVVATASRPETQAWVRDLGAHDVVDHHGDVAAQLADLGLDSVDLIASLNATEQNFAMLADVLTPQGSIAVIDDPEHLDATLLKSKSASLHWEFMFTRSMFATPDVAEQHRLLTEVAALVDRGVVRSTLEQVIGDITAANLIGAHEFVESGRAMGKTVLAGWSR